MDGFVISVSEEGKQEEEEEDKRGGRGRIAIMASEAGIHQDGRQQLDDVSRSRLHIVLFIFLVLMLLIHSSSLLQTVVQKVMLLTPSDASKFL